MSFTVIAFAQHKRFDYHFYPVKATTLLLLLVILLGSMERIEAIRQLIRSKVSVLVFVTNSCVQKIIKAELAMKIFDEPFLTKWLFDVELLARTIIILGEERAKQAIFELPLKNWQDKGGSKLTLYHYTKALMNFS